MSNTLRRFITFVITSVLWAGSINSVLGVVPPPPRDIHDVRSVLAKAPSTPATDNLRPLKIILAANRKDHGAHEHDYPRWMNRWKNLLEGGDTSQSSLESTPTKTDDDTAVNMYGPPSDLSQCPVGGAEGVTVEVARDWPDAEQFASADLVVAFMGTGRIWNDSKLRDLETLLQRGGGFVAIHSAIIAEEKTAEPLADLIGLAWKRGYTTFRHGALNLEITAPNHPITKGLPKVIPFIDETYWPLVGETSGVQVLATAKEKAKGSNRMQPQPMFWTRDHGKGRVFSTVLGHYSWTYDDPYFRIMLLRGMAWATGESAYRFDPLVLCGARITDKKPAPPEAMPTGKPVAPVGSNPNLLLWLDATDRETLQLDMQRHVSSWINKASNNMSKFESFGDQRPLYVPDALGGKAAVRFDGENDLLRNIDFDQSADEWTAVLVAAPLANQGRFHALLATNEEGKSDYESGFNIDLGPRPTPQFSYLNLEGIKDAPGARNLRTKASDLGDGHILVVKTDERNSQLWINGLEEGTRTASDAITAMAEVRVGSRYYKGREQSFYHGDVAEVLVYDKALTDEELDSLYAHLLKKYADSIKIPVTYTLEPWDYLPAYDWGQTRRPLGAIDFAIRETKGEEQARQEIEAKLLAVLVDPGSTLASRDFVCRRLALIGGDASVPVLADLVTNDRLTSVVLFALEGIPGPAATQALKEALERVKGNTRVAIIQAIGKRGSTTSVIQLSRFLKDQDAVVRRAAAEALGEIGGGEAITALQAALTGAGVSEQRAILASLLKCAENFMGNGEQEAALAIYNQLREPGMPQMARVAATRGIILAGGADAVPLLIEQIKSGEPRLQKMALLLAGAMGGSDVTQELASHLGSLTTKTKAMLIMALADRGDPAARPAVLKLLSADEPVVRRAAVEATGRLGTSVDIPLLFEAATSDDKEIAEVAAAALARIPGEEADAAVVEALKNGDVKTCLAAINVIGRRATAAGKATLFETSHDPNGEVRRAAIRELGETIATVEDTSALIQILLRAEGQSDIDAAEKALAELYARSDEKDAWADSVLEALPQARPEQQLALIRALSRHGGKETLLQVTAAAKESGIATQDDYVRVLADWPTVDAADELREIAQQSDTEKQRLLALRGYLRIAGLDDLTTTQRLSMAELALAKAWRDDERRTALGVLAKAPSLDALHILLPHLQDANLRAEASAAIIAIGEKLLPQNSAAVIDAAEEILKTEKNPELRSRAASLRAKAREAGK